MRKPEIISKSRDENLTADTLDKFFEMIRSIYNDKRIFEDANTAKRMYNTNDSGFSTNANQKKMFLKKSSSDAYMVTPTYGKSMHSVLATVDVSSEYMPPLFVYKAQYLNDLRMPTTCTVIESGWMTDVIFEQWFINSLIPHDSSTTKPVIIFFDGHGLI